MAVEYPDININELMMHIRSKVITSCFQVMAIVYSKLQASRLDMLLFQCHYKLE